MEGDNLLEDQVPENENDFEINTGSIFSNEGEYAREGEEYLAKKCPDRLADSLEMTIRSLLEKHTKPSISSTNSTDNYLELKHEKLASGEMAHLQMQNFKVDHFVLKLEYPIEGPRQPSRVGKPEKYFYYLFEFREPLRITKKMVHEETFELLFAFALRQCNLSYLNEFLQYHLDHNFEGELNSFIRFMVLIKRKFEMPLFTDGSIDAVNQWIQENEINVKNSVTEKIKTYLTVEELACLFKALTETNLIDKSNKKSIFRVIGKSFESKTREEISIGSIDKNFASPTFDTWESWEDKFDKLHKFAATQKQKKAHWCDRGRQ